MRLGRFVLAPPPGLASVSPVVFPKFPFPIRVVGLSLAVTDVASILATAFAAWSVPVPDAAVGIDSLRGLSALPGGAATVALIHWWVNQEMATRLGADYDGLYGSLPPEFWINPGENLQVVWDGITSGTETWFGPAVMSYYYPEWDVKLGRWI